MLKNNNGAVLTKMAKKSLKNQKRKNAAIIIAIMLSVFLVFTILTIGETWFLSQKTQNIRLHGTDAEAYLYGGFTEEQKEICENNPDILTIGVGGFAAYGVSTEYDKTLHSIFKWSDDNMWNKLQKPVMKSVKGSYPQNENEVMASKESLKDCGMENLDIGDTFTITYADNSGEHTKDFIISGMYEGYGDNNNFYVSKSFFDASGYTLEDYGRGFLYIKFKSPIITEKVHNDLNQSLNLNNKQIIIFFVEPNDSMNLLIGVVGLIVITCLSAYLLIYNIMYLSVSGNIRYYGLLHTIGMTGKQINQLVRKQMLIIGSIGIVSGIIIGIITSFGFVPAVIKTLGIDKEDINIRFHPAVFVLSIVLVLITIYLGSRKPACMAARISPIQALGYNTASSKSHSGNRKMHVQPRLSVFDVQKQKIIPRMAIKLLTKDKKKTAVITISLAISLSVFMCIVTLVDSLGARNIVSSYMDSDFLIKNDTMQMEEQSIWKPLIDEDFMEQIRNLKSIKEIHPMTTIQIVVPWEPEFMDKWIEEFYDRYMVEGDIDTVKEDYKQHPENHYSFLEGIDKKEFEYLNSTLEHPVDEDDFLNGKTGILFDDFLGLGDEANGRTISFYLYDDKDKMHNIYVGGFTDDPYYAFTLGETPTLIVSDKFIKKLVKEPFVSKLNISYKNEYDEKTEEFIKKMMEDSKYKKDFSYESKLDELNRVTKSQGNMMIIGVVITFIIAFIGIMNYINTSVGNIQSRQTEFSILESIGMTQRQLRKMLVTEGVMYTMASVFFTMTAGLFVTYNIYQYMNYRGTEFSLPLISLAAAIVLIIVVCIGVPLIAYWNITRKRSIIERIRKSE